MVGDRVATTAASSDLLFDTFAVVLDCNLLKVITGTIITRFSEYSLATEDELDFQSYRFDRCGLEVKSQQSG
jgi:hypothetical protein